MRNSFQRGSLVRIHQKSGDVWKFRFREGGKQRSEFVGTLVKYPTKASAEKAAERFRKHLNSYIECITISDLIAKFWKECPPERDTTANGYRSIFKRLEHRWGSLRIDEFARNMQVVEQWLKTLHVVGRHPGQSKRLVSPLYRGQIRNLIHMLLEKAMLWGHLEAQRNPSELIRLKNTGARQKELIIVSLDQYQQLLDDQELPEVVKAMIQVAAGLGLRVSEILGLRWEDFDFENRTVMICRSVVNGESNETKTLTSRQLLPIHDNTVEILQNWRTAHSVIGGWVFGSERTGRPYDRDWLRAAHLQPAGDRIGLEGLGFHSFRHTYRAMQKNLGLSLETQKALMRHSKITTTIDTYGGEDNLALTRPANAKVVEMLPRRTA
jgi:integrase